MSRPEDAIQARSSERMIGTLAWMSPNRVSGCEEKGTGIFHTSFIITAAATHRSVGPGVHPLGVFMGRGVPNFGSRSEEVVREKVESARIQAEFLRLWSEAWCG